MKVCVKKIYCPRCRRLVKGREQVAESRLQIMCFRCGKSIYLWDGIAWRYP